MFLTLFGDEEFMRALTDRLEVLLDKVLFVPELFFFWRRSDTSESTDSNRKEKLDGGGIREYFCKY
jgi:hypothetical protein